MQMKGELWIGVGVVVEVLVLCGEGLDCSQGN